MYPMVRLVAPALVAGMVVSTPAIAADAVSHQLVYDLAVGGQPIGRRTLTVKLLAEDGSRRRVIESWTEIDGAVGPIRVRYRQRLTAHAVGDNPASFHAAIEENGVPKEVQARVTGGGWMVTVLGAGRNRTSELPASAVDLSTADLIDPESAWSLDRFQNIRLLVAETGEVQEGPVKTLGTSEVKVAGKPVPVIGYEWDSPEGKSRFYYSDDGYLVRYEMRLLGLVAAGTLATAPPGGIDDFPVALGRAAVEVIDL